VTGLPGATVQGVRAWIRPTVESACLRVAAPPGGRELSPGNLRKEGPDLELPVAMGDRMHFQYATNY
jgi:predicted ATPase with chaperone activity